MREVAENESWVHFVGLTIVLAVVLSLAYHFAQIIASVIIRPPETAPFFKSAAPDGLFRFPVVLYLAITAGIVEEIFFRGLPLLYVIERFPAKIPTRTYVVTTALLFGSIHWENGGHEVVATFIYGVLAAAYYVKLRDLWPLIGAHALIDVWEFW
jgi:membrane protease YdiL (CAAX protease family)